MRHFWLRRLRAIRPDAAFFADCHDRLDTLLRGAVAFWTRSVDWEHGGFFGLVDYAGRPRPDADKDLIQQVRHLWTFSYLYRFEDRTSAIRDVCEHQYRFVRDRLYGPERRQFHCAVAFDGAPRAGAIHLYSLCFAILGLASYAAAFPETAAGRRALDIALEAFDAVVERSWDPVHGFDETVYPGRWCEHAKEINTQMHLMEAVAELLDAARAHGAAAAGAIGAILDRQVTLVATKAIVERGGQTFCSRGYERDWSLLNDREVDYGHDIEVVYLTISAASRLGREAEPAIVDAVVRLGRSVSELAYDRARGKFYYSGDPMTGRVLQRVANIWVNCEALNGLGMLYRLTSEPAHLDKFERVLRWMETKQYNAAVGEWYYNVDDHGRPLDLDVFGGECGWMTFAWKSSYHSVRAMAENKRWIGEIRSTP